MANLVIADYFSNLSSNSSRKMKINFDILAYLIHNFPKHFPRHVHGVAFQEESTQVREWRMPEEVMIMWMVVEAVVCIYTYIYIFASHWCIHKMCCRYKMVSFDEMVKLWTVHCLTRRFTRERSFRCLLPNHTAPHIVYLATIRLDDLPC